MALDTSVNLGNLLTIVSFLVGGLVFVLVMKNQIELLGVRIAMIETALNGFKGVLETLARQDERLGAMAQQIEDMRHGHGFVFMPGDFAQRPVPPNAKR